MKNYFQKFIKVAPFSHAVWRTDEAKVLSKYRLSKNILDMGCGFGEFAGVFFDNKIQIGIDINSNDINIAKGREIYERVFVEDATKMSIEDNKFDTVISISTLEHIPDAKGAIKEAYRVLKEGGNFIFTVPTSDINQNYLYASVAQKLGLGYVADWYIKTYHRVFKHEIIQPAQEWKRFAEEAGFKEITIEGTLSKKRLHLYEAMLILSLPSQILRVITGKRFVFGNPIRTILFTAFYNNVSNNFEKEYDYSNILVRAVK